MSTIAAERYVRLDYLSREFDRPRLSPTVIYSSVLAFGFLIFLLLELYVLSGMFG